MEGGPDQDSAKNPLNKFGFICSPEQPRVNAQIAAARRPISEKVPWHPAPGPELVKFTGLFGKWEPLMAKPKWLGGFLG